MDAQRNLTTREELEAFADPVRLLLVRVLVTREATLTQLSRYLGLRANLVHYHLHKLLDLGLVRETRRDGAQHYYRSTAMVVGIDPGFRFAPDADLAALPPEPPDVRAANSLTRNALLQLDQAALDRLLMELEGLLERYRGLESEEAPQRLVGLTVLTPPQD